MKKVSKLELSPMKPEEGLSREEMRKIKGGGAGLCYYHCNSTGEEHVVPYTCSVNVCGGSYSCYCL